MSTIPKSRFSQSPQRARPQAVELTFPNGISLNSTVTDYGTESHRFDETGQLEKNRYNNSQALPPVAQYVANAPRMLEYMKHNRTRSSFTFHPGNLEHRTQAIKIDPKFLNTENPMLPTHLSVDTHKLDDPPEEQLFEKTLEASVLNKQQQRTPYDMLQANLATKSSVYFKTQPSELSTNPNLPRRKLSDYSKQNSANNKFEKRGILRSNSGQLFGKEKSTVPAATAKWRF